MRDGLLGQVEQWGWWRQLRLLVRCGSLRSPPLSAGKDAAAVVRDVEKRICRLLLEQDERFGYLELISQQVRHQGSLGWFIFAACSAPGRDDFCDLTLPEEHAGGQRSETPIERELAGSAGRFRPDRPVSEDDERVAASYEIHVMKNGDFAVHLRVCSFGIRAPISKIGQPQKAPFVVLPGLAAFIGGES